MDIKKRAVIILAAGTGSRMGYIGAGINKCAVDLSGTTPLRHIIKAFHKNGINRFIIVLGYKKQSIINSLNYMAENIKIEYIYNQYYDFHGCEYSLSCCYNLINFYDEVFVTEGDLLLDNKNIREIINTKYESGVLVRSKENIDRYRSVVAIGDCEENIIMEFVYDQEHRDVYVFIENKDKIIGESCQVWKLSGKSLQSLQKNLETYFNSCSNGKKRLESGLYSINKTVSDNPMKPVFMVNNNWLNINTYEDVLKGRGLKWLER